LPGIPVSVALLCNDKAAMRKKLTQIGLEDTAWHEAKSIESALKAAEKIGYPCFLKPVDNCGSRGCKRIETSIDLVEWWEEALRFSVKRDQRILVEEFQDGPRQTIEMIVENGIPHLISIIDTHYIYEEPDKYPYGHWPVETGLHMTTQPREMQELLFKHACKIVKAIGINWGPVKVDTTITPKGIKTVELTARLSGGFHCQYATPLAYGTDEITAVAKMAIGERLDMELIRHKYNRAAVVLAKFPEPGRITKIEGIEKAKKIPGIHEVFVLKKVGEYVPVYRNSTDRVAFIISEGEDLTEAKRNAQLGIDTLVIETQK
jgi:biotin carboxylase